MGNRKTRKLKTYPKKYIPSYLDENDAKKIKKEIDKSNKLYKKGIYYTRKGVKTMKIKESKHVVNAKKLYELKSMKLDRNLTRKTGCKLQGLKEIMAKGRGAYFTGSRPGQTPTSWGYARLASSITGGKSAAVDFHILDKYCNKRTSQAYKLALKAKKKHGKGTRRVPKRKM